MLSFVEQLAGNFEYVMLFFLRTSGLIISSPIFGRKSVPALIKITFCLVVGYFFFTVVPVQAEPIRYSGMSAYFMLSVKELLFGIVIGFVTTMFFNLTFVAGQMIDTQIGFGIANVYDVQNNTQIPLLGNVLNLMLLLAFFETNGHRMLYTILLNTFHRVPVGYVQLSGKLAASAAEAFAQSFLLGVSVAFPVIASGMLLEVVLGIMIRTMPQLNMFVVGIPVKLIVGMLVFLFTLPAFAALSSVIFGEMFVSIERMFEGLGAVP